jgi:predicted dehydrogenase
MKKKLRYACIGAGGIADKKHMNNYSKLESVELVAVCDTNIEAAQKLADKYKVVHVYDDYAEMFRNEKLDFVSICVPNFLHAQICIDALKAGLHVHCEKPLALNAEEVKNIIAEKNRQGKKVMVGVNNRFTNESAMIKKLADSDFFGEIYHAKCGWKRNSGIPGIGKWFTEKKYSGGGPLIDLGVHFMDLALYFMGYSRPVSVYGAAYANFKSENTRIRPGYKSVEGGIFNVEDTAVGFVRLENGATIDFDFSWASNIEKEVKYIELLGTKGGMSMVNGEIKLFTQKAGTCFTMYPDEKTIPAAQNEYGHLVECILNDKEPLASPEEACELMKVIDGLYVSASEKREVVLSRSKTGVAGKAVHLSLLSQNS